jgi:tRNA G37 N-methylase TrmD
VLGNSESLVGESFSQEGILGPPQYTRPAVWNGEGVPAVLLSGNHAEIRAWREREVLSRTGARAGARGEKRTDPTPVAPDAPTRGDKHDHERGYQAD